MRFIPGVDHHIKGVSNVSVQMDYYIDLVAGVDIPVFLYGDTGAGKEHVARTIHNRSNRCDAPFVIMHCGLLRQTKDHYARYLEYAAGGTLFLADINLLTAKAQRNLLQLLQRMQGNKPEFQARIITAAVEDINHHAGHGSFSRELAMLLCEFKIKVPRLNARWEDIDEYTDFFLAQANNELNRNVVLITSEARQVINRYNWPGNLGELKHVIKRAVLLCKNNVITPAELPEHVVAL